MLKSSLEEKYAEEKPLLETKDEKTKDSEKEFVMVKLEEQKNFHLPNDHLHSSFPFAFSQQAIRRSMIAIKDPTPWAMDEEKKAPTESRQNNPFLLFAHQSPNLPEHKNTIDADILIDNLLSAHCILKEKYNELYTEGIRKKIDCRHTHKKLSCQETIFILVFATSFAIAGGIIAENFSHPKNKMGKFYAAIEGAGIGLLIAVGTLLIALELYNKYIKRKYLKPGVASIEKLLYYFPSTENHLLIQNLKNYLEENRLLKRKMPYQQLTKLPLTEVCGYIFYMEIYKNPNQYAISKSSNGFYINKLKQKYAQEIQILSNKIHFRSMTNKKKSPIEEALLDKQAREACLHFCENFTDFSYEQQGLYNDEKNESVQLGKERQFRR